MAFLAFLFFGTFSEALDCGFTDHFSEFLDRKGYGSWDFSRSDMTCGAFGGKKNKKDEIVKTPTIFIHGANDIGFGTGQPISLQSGWRKMITYLTIVLQPLWRYFWNSVIFLDWTRPAELNGALEAIAH